MPTIKFSKDEKKTILNGGKNAIESLKEKIKAAEALYSIGAIMVKDKTFKKDKELKKLQAEADKRLVAMKASLDFATRFQSFLEENFK